MAVTREKYQAVYTLWHYHHWTARMIWPHLAMKPWEVEAIIEQLEKERSQEARPQLELFKPKRDVA